MKAKLTEDMKAAMKSRDQLRLNTVRGVLSEIKRAEIDTRTELTEPQCIAIVQKEIKKRRDTIEAAQKLERADLIEQNESEMKILQSYLGDQLNDQQLSEIISKLVAGGADNIGKIMGALKKDYAGKFDGSMANELIKKALG